MNSPGYITLYQILTHILKKQNPKNLEDPLAPETSHLQPPTCPVALGEITSPLRGLTLPSVKRGWGGAAQAGLSFLLLQEETCGLWRVLEAQVSGRLGMGLSQTSVAETCPWGISPFIEPFIESLSFFAGLGVDFAGMYQLWSLLAVRPWTGCLPLDALVLSSRKGGLQSILNLSVRGCDQRDSPFRSHSVPHKCKDQYKFCGEQRVLSGLDQG